MNKALQNTITSLLGIRNITVKAVSGGDISQAYLLTADSALYFCKHHQGSEAFPMFSSEAEGLKAIAHTKTVKTPEVLFCEQWEQGAFLIMEHIASKRPNDSEMKMLGAQLAELHRHSAKSFGWKDDNFIGSLPQPNRIHESWEEFYASYRLQPQLELAVNNRLLTYSEVPSLPKMIGLLTDMCSDVKPSLLHGDLWGGNFLIAENGTPYLIDPAVYYGHNEIDIAMSHLFGGFGAAFYEAYEESFPGDPLSQDRIKIYQLYYLLVHLNLFGGSYYASVISILKEYFR